MSGVEPEVTQFGIEIADAAVADLQDRLRRTRWAEAETVDDWSQGTPLRYLQGLCRYWLEEYDWRAAEARLNRFPQFITTIDGCASSSFTCARRTRTPYPC